MVATHLVFFNSYCKASLSAILKRQVTFFLSNDILTTLLLFPVKSLIWSALIFQKLKKAKAGKCDKYFIKYMHENLCTWTEKLNSTIFHVMPLNLIDMLKWKSLGIFNSYTRDLDQRKILDPRQPTLNLRPCLELFSGEFCKTFKITVFIENLRWLLLVLLVFARIWSKWNNIKKVHASKKPQYKDQNPWTY